MTSERYKTTKYTPNTFRGLASTLRYYAQKYEFIAEQLETRKIEAVQSPNQPTLEKGLIYLRNHLAASSAAADMAIDAASGVIGRMVGEDAGNYTVSESAERDIAEESHKPENYKKTKKPRSNSDKKKGG